MSTQSATELREAGDEANGARGIPVPAMRVVHRIAGVAERAQDERIVRNAQMDAAHAETVGHAMDGEAILQRRAEEPCFRRARDRIVGIQDAKQAKLDCVVRQHRAYGEVIGGRRVIMSHASFRTKGKREGQDNHAADQHYWMQTGERLA
jgi:hypothetical protein